MNSPTISSPTVSSAMSALVISVLAALAMAATPARATPLQYSPGLTNPTTTIDFSGVANGTDVSTLYNGVTFSNLVANTSQGNTLAPTTAPAAANYAGATVHPTFTIVFTTPVTSAAFFLYTDGFNTSITSSLAGATVETTSAGAFGSGDHFFGFANSSFDTITVAVGGTGTALIDNLEIGGTAVQAVPEPGSAILVMGFVGMAALARRRAVRNG